ncbi:MAG: SIP domain-containing protein, partial [Actinomycetota bacterium]
FGAAAALLEQFPLGVESIDLVALVEDAEHEIAWPRRLGLNVRHVHRNTSTTEPSQLLVDAVGDRDLDPDGLFCWGAAERSQIRALRRHLVGDVGVARTHLNLTGYW